LTDKTKISGEFTQMSYLNQQSGGLTDAQFAENPYQSLRNRNWFQVNWAIGNVNIDYKATQNLSFNLKLMALQGERNSIGFVAAPNIADSINKKTNQYNNRQLDSDTYTNYAAEGRGLWQYKAFDKKHNLAFGAKFYQSNTKRFQRGKGDTGTDFNMQLKGDKYPTNLDFETKNIAFFAENAFKITKKLAFTHGIRYENIVSSVAGLATITNDKEVFLAPQSAQRNVILAAAGLQYQLKNTNFYGNIGQAYRPVLYSDLMTSNTTDVIDPNLRDASGFNADLGYRGLIGEFLNFDASLFFVQYNNKIGTLRQFTNNDLTQNTYQFRTNLGEAQHKGAEIFVEFNPCKAFNRCKNGELSLFASLAFTDARYTDFKTTAIKGTAPNVVLSEGNLKNNKVENAPEQIHNFGVTYLIKGFSTTFQVRYNSDFFTDASNSLLPNSTGTIGKIAACSVADWSFKYQFLGKYTIQGSVNNVFNEVYATRRAGGYPGPGLISGEARSFNIGVGCKL
jgi:Fe(3+) dicitrate transport protein